MKLICEGWNNDGSLFILIHNNNKVCRYEYTVDAAFIPDWRKRMRYHPGIVLSEIKRKATHVKRLS